MRRTGAFTSSEPCKPVLVLPGFLNSSSSYTGLSRTLSTWIKHHSRLPDVRIAPMSMGDWFDIVRGGDFTAYMDRAFDLIVDMYQSYEEPVALVGHSAGGWVGRLLLGDVPYQDKVYHASSGGMVSTLVTLGTPHHSIEQYPFGRIKESLRLPPHVQASEDLDITTSSLQYCNYFYPRGDSFGENVRIVCVAGNAITGESTLRLDLRNLSQYLAYQSYKSGCGEGSVPGDGVTPLSIAFLDGAHANLTLDGVRHNSYGDVVDVWGPYILARS
jgi:pimeloyl-ACP methyl ester carboxylesterase